MCDLIIIGGGGHAKVISDIAKLNGYKVRGFLDDNCEIEEFLGYRRLGNVADCVGFSDCCFVIAIGNSKIRREIAESYPNLNYITLIHPSAVIGSNVKIEKGTVVMPCAVINTCAEIGEFCIVNTSAIVEHDCVIGKFTMLAPNCTVCGLTKIGRDCFIGAGSTIKNVLNICDSVTVGLGAAVVKDITKPGTYIGVPAKKI